MTVAELLLEHLEQMTKKDFEKFKWYLTMQNLESYKPIPRSHLEDADRCATVSMMMENYTEGGAVTVAVTVLKKQQMNDLAQKLSNAYSEKLSTVSPTTSSSGTAREASPAAATPAAVAAPAAGHSLVAHEGSVIFAPIISNSAPGTWNVTLRKNE